jgi:hypothetical protein
MKQKLITCFKVFVTMFLLSSCSDDDIDLTSSKSFSVYGLSYDIESSVIWHADNNFVANTKEYVYLDRYTDTEGNEVEDEILGFSLDGSTTQVGYYIVSLYGKGISYSEDLNSAVGKGALITIHFSSENFDELEEGIYEYNVSKEANTFTAYSSSQYDFNTTIEQEIGNASQITQGQIQVVKNDEEYEFKLNCKTSTGSELTGTYLGSCTRVDIKSKISVNHLEEVKMDAVFDTLKTITTTFWGAVFESELEDIQASAVFHSATSGVMSIRDAMRLDDLSKRKIELALCYNRETNSILFKSPIELRSNMWRGMGFNPDVQFPCHTTFDVSPSSFTIDDFDSLNSSEDFSFDVEDNVSEIPVDSELPKIILFETGNGLKGAIKILEITPVAEEESYDWMGSLVEAETNPVATFELKVPIVSITTKLK